MTAPVGMVSVICHPGAGNGVNTREHRGHFREYRTVVLPAYQGCGIGPAIGDAVAAAYRAMGCKYTSSFRHPVIHRHRSNSCLWEKRHGSFRNYWSVEPARRDKTDGDPKDVRESTQLFSYRYVGEPDAPTISGPYPCQPQVCFQVACCFFEHNSSSCFCPYSSYHLPRPFSPLS